MGVPDFRRAKPEFEVVCGDRRLADTYAVDG